MRTSRRAAAAAAVLPLVAAVTAAGAAPAASEDAGTSAKGPTGQTLTVSRTTGLDPAGTRLTVTGRGYALDKGVYLALCAVPEKTGEAPSPCMGGADLSGATGSSYWISSNPPDYAKDLVKPFTAGPDGKGGFELTLNAKGREGDLDCTKVACAVVTRADHTHISERDQDVLVPVSFATATTEPDVPAGTVRHAVLRTLAPQGGSVLDTEVDAAKGRLYASGGDGTTSWLDVYDTTSGERIGERLRLPAPATVLSLTPDGATLLLGLSTRVAAYDTGSGKLTDEAVPGQGSVSLLATDGRVLYVGDQARRSVSVYALGSGERVGEPAVFPFFPAGLAADAAHGTAYATYVGGAMENGAVVYRNVLNAVSGTTGKVTGTVSLGTTALGSMGVAVDPATRTGYVANLAAGSVSVVDLAALEVTGTLTVGGNPKAMAYDTGTRTLYVARTTASSVAVVDPAEGEVTGTIATGDKPAALALDGTRHELFAVASGTVTQAARQVSPTVVAQPRPVTAKAGAEAVFTASADGTPRPAVGWETSADGKTWQAVPDATGTTLTLRAAPALDGHAYRAVFRNAAGVLRSEPAKLTVTGAPSPDPGKDPSKDPGTHPTGPAPTASTPSDGATDPGAGAVGGSSGGAAGGSGNDPAAQGPGASGPLASTGSSPLPLALGAAALAVTGAGAVLYARRRRTPGTA
ncbi:endoglucanase [Streptomyces sp. NPDC001941]|uniref:endoglucanase n=1 Tax=Streptomyces sp. NPDC001941 TaxID=3154659 RepID=UPI003322432C